MNFLLAALAHLASVQTPPPPPPSAAIFANCIVQGPVPGVDRTIRCDDYRVSVTVAKPKEAGEAMMLQIADQQLKSNPNATQDSTLESLYLAGEERQARRFTLKNGTGYIAILPAAPPEGFVRMATCEETRAGRCRQALEALAASLPAPNQSSAELPLRFADRVLQVPNECITKGPGQLTCGTSELTWGHFPLSRKDLFETTVAALSSGLARYGDLARKETNCTVGGAKARCVLFTVTSDEGKHFYALYGLARLGNEQVSAQCNTGTDLPKSMPVPCDQVLKLR